MRHNQNNNWLCTLIGKIRYRTWFFSMPHLMCVQWILLNTAWGYISKYLTCHLKLLTHKLTQHRWSIVVWDGYIIYSILTSLSWAKLTQTFTGPPHSPRFTVTLWLPGLNRFKPYLPPLKKRIPYVATWTMEDNSSTSKSSFIICLLFLFPTCHFISFQ